MSKKGVWWIIGGIVVFVGGGIGSRAEWLRRSRKQKNKNDLLFLGDSATGKTTLTEFIQTCEFKTGDDLESTLGVEKYDIKGLDDVKRIWDTGGRASNLPNWWKPLEECDVLIYTANAHVIYQERESDIESRLKTEPDLLTAPDLVLLVRFADLIQDHLDKTRKNNPPLKLFVGTYCDKLPEGVTNGRITQQTKKTLESASAVTYLSQQRVRFDHFLWGSLVDETAAEDLAQRILKLVKQYKGQG